MFSCRRNDAEEKPRQKEGRGRRLVTVSRGAEAPHSSEPQKAHPTGEFVGVA